VHDACGCSFATINSTEITHFTLTHSHTSCQPKPLVQAASVDHSAPEVVERTTRLLEEYSKQPNDPPMSEDDALVAIHKGVDPKAADEVSALFRLCFASFV
jgi:hypothetical protein